MHVLPVLSKMGPYLIVSVLFSDSDQPTDNTVDFMKLKSHMCAIAFLVNNSRLRLKK